MKTETFSGKIENAYGQALPTPVSFSGSFDAFENYDEVKQANEVLSNDEMLQVVNAKRKNNARAKASIAALDAAGIMKPDPNSPEQLRAGLIKNLVKAKGLDEATAASIVDGLLAAK